ncbi:MAG: hypothetical protein ACTSWP_04770 [Candidatus Freyarchaeota archaeon]
MSVVNEYEFTKDPDVNLLISAAREAAMEVRGVYGPVYEKLVVKYGLAFEAEKTGEKPPEDVETIDGLVDYVSRKLRRTPKGTALFMACLRRGMDFRAEAGQGRGVRRSRRIRSS